MIDYSTLLRDLEGSDLGPWLTSLPTQIESGLSAERYGDLPKWLEALASLPKIAPSSINLSKGVSIGSATDCRPAEHAATREALQALIPWRKGPYSIFDIDIDTEWRSDWKWERLLPHIAPLSGRTILDVGCGNGYHCLRMLGEKARRVIGIDPSPRFIVQFYMLKHFLGDIAADLIPVGIEGLPKKLAAFDTTFSMGVLYHRRSPMGHLKELQDTLVPGGELVLETLIIDGQLGDCLVPEGRYAKMNNVWFIPSEASLISWLTKCGYTNVRCVDTSVTNTQEQRSTAWMKFHSLPDFLDPENPQKTAEGHPAPMRGIFIANKPSSMRLRPAAFKSPT
ncbi:MAG: tRNA (mo5U34)-methyltransferase [Lentisphaeria bacterium]|jgi:tRNA (mo5U34)-methyltransferase